MENFYNSFVKYLISIDFEHYISNEYFEVFYKKIGTNLYIVSPIIISSSNNYLEKTKLIKDLEIFFKDKKSEFNTNRILFLQLYITENEFSTLNEFCNINTDLEETLIPVRWIIDIKNNKISVYGNQITKLIKLEKSITSILTDENFKKTINITLQEKQLEQTRISKNFKFPKVTITLIFINILSYIILELSGGSDNIEILKQFGAIVPSKIVAGENYRLFTSMFLHSGLSHLSSNLLSLWLFGSRVEVYFGKINYLIIYFISGIGSGITSCIFTRNIAVGASGGIFGLESTILIYCIFKGRKMIGMDLFLILTFIVLGVVTGFINPNVDNAGHIGGILTGAIISTIILIRERKNLINSNKK